MISSGNMHRVDDDCFTTFLKHNSEKITHNLEIVFIQGLQD